MVVPLSPCVSPSVPLFIAPRPLVFRPLSPCLSPPVLLLIAPCSRVYPPPVPLFITLCPLVYCPLSPLYSCLPKVKDIAQKYKHRADLEYVYPKSYWNKNRVKAATEGEVNGASEPTRLFVDVKTGAQ